MASSEDAAKAPGAHQSTMGVSNGMTILMTDDISEIAWLPTEEAEQAPKRYRRNANRSITAVALPAEGHSD